MEKQMTLKQYQDKLTTDTLGELQVNMQRGMVFPRNYVPQNALMNAMLYLAQAVDKNQKPVLSVCSPDSVKQALLKMLQSGLDVGKTQGYFIAYGTKLTWMTSYFGHICQAKAADPTIKDIFGEIVYEDDKFRYQIKHGNKVITEHEQEPENIDRQKIKGCYATILYHDGREVSEYMTLDQIKRSWNFGQTKGGSSAHKETPEEMCKRTVINRLTKPIINSADDSMMIDQMDEIDREADENQNTVMLDITPPEPMLEAGADQDDEIPEEIEPPKKAQPVKQAEKPVKKAESVPVGNKTTKQPEPEIRAARPDSEPEYDEPSLDDYNFEDFTDVQAPF